MSAADSVDAGGASAEAPPARERILGATTATIRRSGVRDVRVQTVAADAGVSTPLVYHYFGNRAGLVRAALATVVGASDGPVQLPGVPPARRLNALLTGGVDDAPEARDAAAMRNELAASALFDPELAGLLADDTARREEAVAAVLRDAAPGAPAPPSPDLVARALVGLTDGLVERWLGGLIDADRTRSLVARAVEAVLPS